jgi:hypothetical protein
LKEMISVRFNQNLPQGGNWPAEDRSQKLSLHFMCSYSKIVLTMNWSSTWWTSNKPIHQSSEPINYLSCHQDPWQYVGMKRKSCRLNQTPHAGNTENPPRLW